MLVNSLTPMFFLSTKETSLFYYLSFLFLSFLSLLNIVLKALFDKIPLESEDKRV